MHIFLLKKILKIKILFIFFLFFYFLINFNFSFAQNATNSIFLADNFSLLKNYYTEALQYSQFRLYAKFENSGSIDFKGYVYTNCAGNSFDNDQIISLAKNGDVDTVFFDDVINLNGEIKCFFYFKDLDKNILFRFPKINTEYIPVNILPDINKNKISDSVENVFSVSSTSSANGVNSPNTPNSSSNNINNINNYNNSSPNSGNNNGNYFDRFIDYFRNVFNNSTSSTSSNPNPNLNPNNNLNQEEKKSLNNSTNLNSKSINPDILSLKNSTNTSIIQDFKNISNKSFSKNTDKDMDGIDDEIEKKYNLNPDKKNTYLLPDNVVIYLIKYWYLLLIFILIIIILIKERD